MIVTGFVTNQHGGIYSHLPQTLMQAVSGCIATASTVRVTE
jgi:hypothetical protein